MYKGYSTKLIYLDEAFTIIGPQLLSDRIVKMTCRHRGDNGKTKIIVAGVEIPATTNYISSHDKRGLTCLKRNGIEVQQVEHILSALCGMDALDTDIYLEYEDGGVIDDIIAPPIAHLSSRDFSLAIKSCFLLKNKKNNNSALSLKESYIFKEKVDVGQKNDPACAIFAPLNKLHITVQINFPYFWGKQIYSKTITPLDYMKSICWARTFFATPFPHKNEWDELRRRYPGVLRERENHFRSMMLDYDENDWITPPIVYTEPVRHKMLDFIGELALLGAPLKAGIHIYKPYHRFNRECIMELVKKLELF